MERQRVTSTNLCAVGYDEESSTLEVEFNSGYIYHFFGVPFHLYSSLMFAGSKGEFFDRFIRKARYSYRQVW